MRFAKSVLFLFAIAACSGQEPVPGDELGEAQLHVRAPAATQPDQQCMQIDAMRFSDFSHSGYLGATNGARFNAREGDTRITAIAFGGNCNFPPAWEDAPWIADQVVVTLNRGRNDVLLTFRPNVKVVVDTDFQDQPPLNATEELRVSIGRNGEGAGMANGVAYALNGWDVSAIDVPAPGSGAGAGTEAFLFSTKGPPANIPYSPRGIGVTPGGTLVFSVGEPFQNVWAFDTSGNFLATWSVLPNPPGMIDMFFVDSFTAIDDSHFARLGAASQGFDCNPDCRIMALEILEKVIHPDTSVTLQVIQQIPLDPNMDGYGVAAVGGGRFAISYFAEPQDLVLIEADGTEVARHAALPSEGIFHDAANGRIVTVSYGGALNTFDDDDLDPQGETAQYPDRLGANNPVSLAWSSNANQFIVLATADDNHFTMATDDGATGTTVAANFESITQVSALEYLPGPNQIAVMDRFPPQDDFNLGPRLTLFNTTGGDPVGTIILQGIGRPVRSVGLGYIGSLDQLVSLHRIPNNPANDAKFFRHDMAGNLQLMGDLAPHGMQRLGSASWLPATNELLFLGTDISGTQRWVVTSLDGNPVRSYRAFEVSDGAPITSGPNAGKLGAVQGQPSELVRLSGVQ